MDAKQFAGKRALVTGGSRGIGAAIAKRLGAQGAHVAVGYRSKEDEAQKVADEIASGGGTAVIVGGDIAIPEQAESMVIRAHEEMDGLDIVINCAGIMDNKLLGDITAEHCRTLLDTNVMGPAILTKAAAGLITAPGGRIVHFSSRLAFGPIPSSTVYSASKAAVITLVHGFARELGPRGITINAIAPGVIETDMTTEALAARRDVIVAGTPLGRIGQPDDIEGIAVFLASDDARWITGRTIIADGGLQ